MKRRSHEDSLQRFSAGTISESSLLFTAGHEGHFEGDEEMLVRGGTD